MKKFFQLIVGLVVVHPLIASAQSIDSFSAKPFSDAHVMKVSETKITKDKSLAIKPAVHDDKIAVVNTNNTAPKISLVNNKQANESKYGETPVIMFCAKPQANNNSQNNDNINEATQALVQNNYTQNLASSSLNPQNINPQNNNVSDFGNSQNYGDGFNTRNQTGSARPNQRGPFKAIYEDTKTAIKRDVPQAIADAIPWVDANRKQEPFDQVLDRVSDNLMRAKTTDPEWALPAQSEIRELAVKLDRLSTPPQIAADFPTNAQSTYGNSSRNFRPRPVWPGAQVSQNETQLRPMSLTTNGVEEEGGVSLINNSGSNFDSEDQPEAPKAKPKKTRRR